MAFTCGKCDTKQARTFSKDSYENGVVLLRCGGCDNQHLIADNLGWFRDEKTNINDLMREKGDSITTNIDDNSIEFNIREPEEEQNVQIEEESKPKFPVKSRYEIGNKDAKHTLKIEFCGG